MHDGSVGVGAQDDVGELFGLDETALGAHGVGELLTLGDGLGANLSGGVYVVLGLDGGNDLRRGDAEFRELLRLDPDAEGILATEDLYARDAFDAGDLVLQVDDGVVGEEVLAELASGRVDGNKHKRRSKRLLHGEAGGGDLRGKLRLGLVDAKLAEDLVDVWIGLDVEVDKELDDAVVGADRIHIDHVVDAVHLLLDGGRDGFGDGLRVGAGVGGGDENLSRNDVRVLRGGEREHRHGSDNDREDGDNDCDDGAAYKKLRHRLTSLPT